MARPVGRFAPTPSGYLHLGNLFCSLIAWLAAKSRGGKMILRNEDLDVERSRPEYALQAQRDLDALGLFWDQGGDKGGPHSPYDQSQRFDFYRVQLEKLEAAGAVHKVNTEEGALYQYCGRQSQGHRDCFLLKCERCGRIRHVDCTRLQNLYDHLEREHHFRIDPRGTLFSGVCDVCAGEEDHHGAQ